MIFAHELNLEDKIESKMHEKIEIQLCKNFYQFSSILDSHFAKLYQTSQFYKEKNTLY